MSADDLERFVTAQRAVFAAVLTELEAGRKRTHWMWFVFPQLRGLGSSEFAIRCGIASLDEARAYLAHPVLGERLLLCTEKVLGVRERTLHEIFGSPDDMKFRSCMTLFAAAADAAAPVFQQALDRFCSGAMDARTVALLPS